MDYKTLDNDLQLYSAKSALLNSAPLHGASKGSDVSALVDTRIYETAPSNSFELSEETKTYKDVFNSNTGHTFKISTNNRGDTNLVKNKSESRIDSLNKSYSLLDEASKTLYSKPLGKHQHRTCKCNKVRIDTNVTVLRDSEGRSFFGGLMQCGSVWTCPICSRKINEYKASDMRAAFNAALSRKHNIELMTFTFPHSIKQTLKANLQKLKLARQDFWRSSTVKRFRKLGYIGRIDSFEITHGKNGWHPHVHAILFTENAKAKESEYLLRSEWINCLFKHKLASCLERKGLERSLDIRDGSKAGDYITKFGSDGESKLTKSGDKFVHWDMADETTKAHVKTGRDTNVTPFDMLRISSSTTCSDTRKKYRSLFREYAKEMKGKSQIRWSRGLRDFYGVNADISDQEIVELEHETATIKAVINKKEWSELLNIEIKGTGEKIRTYLRYFASLDTKNTTEHHVLARYIYDRTSQDCDFKTYYDSFIERNSLIE